MEMDCVEIREDGASALEINKAPSRPQFDPDYRALRAAGLSRWPASDCLTHANVLLPAVPRHIYLLIVSALTEYLEKRGPAAYAASVAAILPPFEMKVERGGGARRGLAFLIRQADQLYHTARALEELGAAAGNGIADPILANLNATWKAQWARIHSVALQRGGAKRARDGDPEDEAGAGAESGSAQLPSPCVTTVPEGRLFIRRGKTSSGSRSLSSSSSSDVTASSLAASSASATSSPASTATNTTAKSSLHQSGVETDAVTMRSTVHARSTAKSAVPSRKRTLPAAAGRMKQDKATSAVRRAPVQRRRRAKVAASVTVEAPHSTPSSTSSRDDVRNGFAALSTAASALLDSYGNSAGELDSAWNDDASDEYDLDW